MEAKLISQFKTPLMQPQFHNKRSTHRRHDTRLHGPGTVAVLSEHANNEELPSSQPSSKTVYSDSWVDLAAINRLSTSMQATIGMKSKSTGYDGLVETSRATHRIFNSSQQQQIVLQTLDRAITFPPWLLTFMKTILPNSKSSREIFATFTAAFFPWLVGPCEVRESEFEGGKEKNVVYIKKCRFLEESNCVGMCTNLCKSPSQVYVKKTFGIPFQMVPNYEDMSCEMIFGPEPPQPADDPAFSQPCYKLCKQTKKPHKCVV